MRTQNLNDFKNKYFSKNKKKIQLYYPKRNRKQIDRGSIIDSTLLDFRKVLY